MAKYGSTWQAFSRETSKVIEYVLYLSEIVLGANETVTKQGFSGRITSLGR